MLTQRFQRPSEKPISLHMLARPSTSKLKGKAIGFVFPFNGTQACHRNYRFQNGRHHLAANKCINLKSLFYPRRPKSQIISCKILLILNDNIISINVILSEFNLIRSLSNRCDYRHTNAVYLNGK